MITQEKIDSAIYETIYWWNRSEAYYHNCLHRFDEVYQNKELLEVFKVKVFQVFLREYSVRRNIAEGTESVDLFLEQLVDFGFFEGVLSAKIETIDEVSREIKNAQYSSTKKRHAISLLSKIAFLVNPHVFVLNDALAKKSLYDLYKDTIKPKSKIETYQGFYDETQKVKVYLEEQGYFQNRSTILENFKNTSAYDFFRQSENDEAFKLRILDKFLWLEQQKNRFSKTQFVTLSNF